MLAKVRNAANELNYNLNIIIDIAELQDDEDHLSSILIKSDNSCKILISKKLIEFAKYLPKKMFEGILLFNISHEFGHIILDQKIIPKFISGNDDVNKKKEYEADNIAIEIMFEGMKLPATYRTHIDFYFLFFHLKNDVDKVPIDSKYHPKNLERKNNLNQIITQLKKIT